jgi:hypothetical protein
VANSGIAADPTSNSSKFRVWLNKTGGVRTCPRVKLVMVTSNRVPCSSESSPSAMTGVEDKAPNPKRNPERAQVKRNLFMNFLLFLKMTFDLNLRRSVIV